jgi:hypothetical protein
MVLFFNNQDIASAGSELRELTQQNPQQAKA